MSNNKLTLPLALVVVLTILVGAFYFTTKKAVSPQQGETPVAKIEKNNQKPSQKEESELTLLPATGKADDAVTAVLGDITSEETLVAQEIDEADAALNESLDTNDLSGLYEENEF